MEMFEEKNLCNFQEKLSGEIMVITCEAELFGKLNGKKGNITFKEKDGKLIYNLKLSSGRTLEKRKEIEENLNRIIEEEGKVIIAIKKALKELNYWINLKSIDQLEIENYTFKESDRPKSVFQISSKYYRPSGPFAKIELRGENSKSVVLIDLKNKTVRIKEIILDKEIKKELKIPFDNVFEGGKNLKFEEVIKHPKIRLKLINYV